MSNPFAFGQLAKALDTSQLHEDPAVRERAAKRAESWRHTVEGMAVGSINLGSRAPVKSFPPWVTLQVNYGGFASGKAAAGEVDAEERAEGVKLCAVEAPGHARVCGRSDSMREADSQETIRSRLFSHYLSDKGLTELYAALETGAFRVRVPEDAALLTVAWLFHRGDAEGAVEIIEAILPFATQLRFAPRTAPPAGEGPPPGYVSRRSVQDARDALNHIRPAPDIEVQRTALSVWNPLSDDFLSLWHPRVPMPYGRLDEEAFSDAWIETARGLISRFDAAVATHGAPSRRRQNLEWLVDATREALTGPKLADRTNGRARIAVEGMVGKRGAPGSLSLTTLRTRQARIAKIPSTSALGKVVSKRLAGLYGEDGILDPTLFTESITSSEAEEHNIAEGHWLPPSIVRVVRSTYAAPLNTLVSEKLISSAEVYASLLPQEVCRVVASSYSDPTLGRLMAANYTAFAKRRSLLLLNYEHQVRISELPWVMATEKYRVKGDMTSQPARQVLIRAGEVAIQQWPGTILPNPLVSQLSNLIQAAELNTPLVEEIAADIFMGNFSSKFSRAAALAAKVVQGTVYARYYKIDTGALLPATGAPEVEPIDLGPICSKRAADMRPPPYSPSWRSWIVENGEAIEQCQILTTHNLAALVTLGVKVDWYPTALDAWHVTKSLLQSAVMMPRSLATVKNAAYAWRQALFFLSMAEKDKPDIVQQFVSDIRAELTSATRGPSPPDDGHHIPRFDLLLSGLADVAMSASASWQHPQPPRGRVFLGWSHGPHWILNKESPAHSPAPRERVRSPEVMEWEEGIKTLYEGWTEVTVDEATG